MDTSKALTLLCALILAVCLVLSITALVSLRHAVDESARLREDVTRLQSELADCIAVWKDTQPESDGSLPTVGTTDPDPLYLICATDSAIAIYAEDGSLVRLIDVNPDTLPLSDREELLCGIELRGWQAVTERIADYTT